MDLPGMVSQHLKNQLQKNITVNLIKISCNAQVYCCFWRVGILLESYSIVARGGKEAYNVDQLL